MYRITYSQKISDAFRQSPSLSQDFNSNLQKRRIYRWGTLWGILEGEKWTCERRIQLHHTEEYLVEQIVPIQCDVLPKDIDDCWEEEYLPLSKGLEYTGLVIIKGDERSVLGIVDAYRLPKPVLPALPSEIQAIQPACSTVSTKSPKETLHRNQSHNTHSKHNKNVSHKQVYQKEKSRCMIQD